MVKFIEQKINKTDNPFLKHGTLILILLIGILVISIFSDPKENLAGETTSTITADLKSCSDSDGGIILTEGGIAKIWYNSGISTGTTISEQIDTCYSTSTTRIVEKYCETYYSSGTWDVRIRSTTKDCPPNTKCLSDSTSGALCYPICGNQIVTPPETCDDGNAINTDGCTYCKITNCVDNIKNQDETDVNCGGTVCPKCDVDKICQYNWDCKSGYCNNNKCIPSPMKCDRPAGQSALKGDLNADENINSIDSQLMTNAILGIYTLPQNICCADLNNDNLINAVDSQSVTNMILGTSPIGERCA